MTTIKQHYEAYRAECEKTDAGRHGAVLREMTEREQSLYDDWQAAIKECNTWRDDESKTTWHVLSRYQDGDLEMWKCRIIIPEYPDGMIADCYASFIRQSAQPVEDDEISVAHNS
jgi:hypothetical protein